MTTTVNDGSTTLTPILVCGYKATRPTRNVIQDIIGTEAPKVTLRAPGMRKGTLEFLVDTFENAWHFEQFHAQTKVFLLTDDEVVGMYLEYVTAGDISVGLDPDTRKRWVVSVDFQEVST